MGVAACGIEGPAQRGAAHDQGEEDHGRDGKPTQDRQPDQFHARKSLKAWAHFVAVDPLAIGQQKDDPAENRHGAQRDHNGRDVELPDQEAVEHAQQPAKAQRNRQDDHHGQPRHGQVDHGHDHARQRQIGRYRQIDAPGQDHDHLADCQKDQGRSVVEHPRQVAWQDKTRKPCGNKRQQQGNGTKQQEFA